MFSTHHTHHKQPASKGPVVQYVREQPVALPPSRTDQQLAKAAGVCAGAQLIETNATVAETMIKLGQRIEELNVKKQELCYLLSQDPANPYTKERLAENEALLADTKANYGNQRNISANLRETVAAAVVQVKEIVVPTRPHCTCFPCTRRKCSFEHDPGQREGPGETGSITEVKASSS